MAAAAEAAGARVTPFLVEPDGLGMARIADLLGSGEVEVEVAETFALEDVVKAHELGERGRTRGKIVLRVDHDEQAASHQAQQAKAR